jgi:HTH-type transcriptional regulator/antitoxin HipB
MEHIVRTSDQLGTVLRNLRKSRRLSQREIGEKVGLKQTTISNIEQNAARTSVASLYKVLSALDVVLVLRHDQPGRTTVSTREW